MAENPATPPNFLSNLLAAHLSGDPEAPTRQEVEELIAKTEEDRNKENQKNILDRLMKTVPGSSPGHYPDGRIVFGSETGLPAPRNAEEGWEQSGDAIQRMAGMGIGGVTGAWQGGRVGGIPGAATGAAIGAGLGGALPPRTKGEAARMLLSGSVPGIPGGNFANRITAAAGNGALALGNNLVGEQVQSKIDKGEYAAPSVTGNALTLGLGAIAGGAAQRRIGAFDAVKQKIYNWQRRNENWKYLNTVWDKIAGDTPDYREKLTSAISHRANIDAQMATEMNALRGKWAGERNSQELDRLRRYEANLAEQRRKVNLDFAGDRADDAAVAAQKELNAAKAEFLTHESTLAAAKKEYQNTQIARIESEIADYRAQILKRGNGVNPDGSRMSSLERTAKNANDRASIAKLEGMKKVVAKTPVANDELPEELFDKLAADNTKIKELHAKVNRATGIGKALDSQKKASELQALDEQSYAHLPGLADTREYTRLMDEREAAIARIGEAKLALAEQEGRELRAKIAANRNKKPKEFRVDDPDSHSGLGKFAVGSAAGLASYLTHQTPGVDLLAALTGAAASGFLKPPTRIPVSELETLTPPAYTLAHRLAEAARAKISPAMFPLGNQVGIIADRKKEKAEDR